MTLPSTTLDSMLSCSNREKNLYLQIYKRIFSLKIEREEGAYAAPTCPSSSTGSTEVVGRVTRGGTGDMDAHDGRVQKGKIKVTTNK